MASHGEHHLNRRLFWAIGALVAAGGTALLMGMAASAAPAGPTLTVIGYAVVNTTPVTEPGQQMLSINLQETASTAAGALSATYTALAALRKTLEKAGVPASAITVQQSTPNLNDNNSNTWQTNDGLQVNFATLAQVARVIDQTGLTQSGAVNGLYIQSQASTENSTTPGALTQGYAAAVANARANARALARADHLTLGAQLTMEQGSLPSVLCQGMGACVPSTVPEPTPGPNQEVVGVTVTFATSS